MKKPVPHILIVSWVFIFIGILALVRTLDSLFYSSRPTIDFLLVFILIGIGLLRRNSLARTFAIACCTVQLVFSLVALILIATGRQSVAGASTGSQVLFWLTTIISILVCGYGLWALQTKSTGVFKK